MNKKIKFNDDAVMFAEESTRSSVIHAEAIPWRVMIVDDDPAVHEVTLMALADVIFNERPIQFISAYSAADAKIKLNQHDDIALIFLDVVMETDDAGLKLAEYIRYELDNKLVRIVLRTGQPGQAPEHKIIVNYDINDYKEKTELSAGKLFTALVAGLRGYESMKTIDASRKGLREIINTSVDFFRLSNQRGFARGVLNQLSAFIQSNPGALLVRQNKVEGVAVSYQQQNWKIFSGSSKFDNDVDKDLANVLPGIAIKKIDKAIKTKKHFFIEDGYLVTYFEDHVGNRNALIFEGVHKLSELEHDLIRLFTNNISVCFENIHLVQELDDSQKEIIYLLGTAIEKEVGNHVKRVAEVSYFLAHKLGLSEKDALIVKQASPLHDLGKIGIPHHILNKPGKHDSKEQEVMRSHVMIGYNMLKQSKRDVLQAAAVIALTHHERWDGKGYPDGKKAEQIHLYGRITMVADVTDALLSKRVYKEAWSMSKTLKYVREHSGTEFDPKIATIFIENIDEIKAIRDLSPD